MAESMKGLKRSCYCGEPRESDAGKEITVCGWVQRQRDLGQLIFVDLRDRTGLVQLAFDETTAREVFEKAASVRSEYVLATGAAVGALLPGEEPFVGRGVSYCATCDGMLYRGRKAVVTGDAADLAGEVAFLNRIGVQVTVATRKPAAGLPEGVEAITARTLAVEGQDRLEGLSADGRLIPCDVVFILREVMAPDSLAPGLELDGRFVRVNREQETNIPGLYAAGDCTGRPLQVAKAVGEGLVAGQNAARSLGQGE